MELILARTRSSGFSVRLKLSPQGLAQQDLGGSAELRATTETVLSHEVHSRPLRSEEQVRGSELRVVARAQKKFVCGIFQSTGRPTAPVVARYRCFLPDLAGLAGLRRVGPGTLRVYHLGTVCAGRQNPRGIARCSAYD